MSKLIDPKLAKTFKLDKQYLEETAVPILTLSASYKEDLKHLHGLPNNNTLPDLVFSRAHYSMALALASALWQEKIDHHKAWIVDPTNYVSARDWNSVRLTHAVGTTIARHSWLQKIKTYIDTHLRSKLPLVTSITTPLLHLTEHINCPILSIHIAVGNILLGQGKTVVQVVTDPHVRDEYVFFAHLPTAWFCVFDEQTKTEFLEKAAVLNKVVDPNRVVVTGPPIDPRISAKREKKQPWRSGKLNICVATGGLGTNKHEIMAILEQLAPELRKTNSRYRLLLYASTHNDIYEAGLAILKKHGVHIGDIGQETAVARCIYHPQLTNANELLVAHGFGWADIWVSKPSADIAYEAIASGACLLTLNEWGVWEDRIREIFVTNEAARPALTEEFMAQLAVITNTANKAQSWVEKAMHKAQKMGQQFSKGNKRILAVVEKAGQQKAT